MRLLLVVLEAKIASHFVRPWTRTCTPVHPETRTPGELVRSLQNPNVHVDALGWISGYRSQPVWQLLEGAHRSPYATAARGGGK